MLQSVTELGPNCHLVFLNIAYEGRDFVQRPAFFDTFLNLILITYCNRL